MSTETALTGLFILFMVPFAGAGMCLVVWIMYAAVRYVADVGERIDYAIAHKRLQKAADTATGADSPKYLLRGRWRREYNREWVDEGVRDYGLRFVHIFRWVAYYLIALAVGGIFIGFSVAIGNLRGGS
jgi:hypothetical protein